MSLVCHRYLSDAWKRDKVLAIVQFAPLILASPIQSTNLGRSLYNLSKMADGYRAITRLSLLLNALSKETLEELVKSQGDAILDRVSQLGHLCHILFCVCENAATFANHGVLCEPIRRLGSCAVVFWFYNLFFGIVRQVYLLTQKKSTDSERKQGLITLLKLGCFFVFSLTCIPKGGPQLIHNGTGPLATLNKSISFLAPKHLELSDAIRGTLGFIASVCDFY